jgi:PKD domain
MIGTERVVKLGAVKLAMVLVGTFSFCNGVFGGTREGTAQAPTSTEIALDPAIECWYDSEFPILGAQVTPPEDIVHSRLYFRCSLYPDYYFVDLADDNGTLRAVAPKADDKCPRVHYYVEVLGRDFTSTRTEERIADVTSASECRKRYPTAAWFPGDDPKIFLGSTINGPAMAPGFKTLGIAGFISSSGATVPAAGGGISTGVIAGLAAAGGAVGVGVLVANGGNGSTTTTAPSSPPPPPTTTTVPPTTSVPAVQALKACFQLDPVNGVITEGDPLKIDGRCSEGGDKIQFHYDLGDGRVKQGQAFITAVWQTAGTYTLTLTVSRDTSALRSGAGAVEENSFSRQITVERAVVPDVVADFSAGFKPDTCFATFDASPSTGIIDRYQWALDVNNDLGSGVIRLEGKRVTYDWKSACFRSNGSFVARLTVIGPAGNSDTLEKTITIFIPLTVSRDANGTRTVEGSVSTAMLDSKGARGQVMLGEAQSYPVTSDTPVMIRYSARTGRNELRAVMASETPALWRFDFSGTRGFVAGSLRTLAGQEVSRDQYSVVLRFSGQPGERAQLEYRIEP